MFSKVTEKMKIVLFIIVLISNSAIGQTKPNTVNTNVEKEANLVSTFTRYFSNKTELKPLEREVQNLNELNVVKSSDYDGVIDNIISVGKTFIGIPYRWGGVSELGFDCSGFIKYIFEWFGYHLPRTSREMVNVGTYVNKNELQKGDLIFFTGRNSRSGQVGHIGIVVSVNESQINIMHSSSSQGVHIEDLNKSDYFSRRYITARRLDFYRNQSNTH